MSDFRVSYTVLMLLYGLGTLITGTVIRFAPLIVGGIIAWVCAALLVWVNFPEALLVLGVSVLAGYIIPGYLLKTKRENKQKTVV
jgi:dolichol kinase